MHFWDQVGRGCRGPVRCGDLLVPSGLNDGVAIGRRSLDREGALGTALESGDSPHDMEHTVLCLVRWRERPRPVRPSLGSSGAWPSDSQNCAVLLLSRRGPS